ncbi:hypothetical protein [Vibrio viridaestus]|uniref:Sel1 repeat family protein n=1 Tax=Vibrio viridaestus TaxID=2487322 RepID=A0A3N9U9W6_9VIBR|nr:hypothetical protein [Vibrio viridaestus]RQW65086.1 hypothetical protein EES38_03370 [Vibrio viridaestus]
MIKIISFCFTFLFFLSAEISAATIEDGIIQFNQRNYQQAKTIFKSLAEQGNSRATFWLGIAQFKTGKQFDAGGTLLKAAEEGNPWAMRLMVPSQNGYCDYLGWDCDEAWMDKAISSWEKLAEKGDGKAIYALLRYRKKSWWSNISLLSDDEKNRFKLIKKAVYAGGFKAASYNQFRGMHNIEEQLELLQYEIDKGYAPAMVDLYLIAKENNFEVNASESLLMRALKLGYSGGAFSLYYSANDKLPEISTVDDVVNISDKDKLLFKDAYFYALIAKYFGKEHAEMTIKYWVSKKNGDSVYLNVLSNKEMNNISKKVERFLSVIKINDFNDDSTVGGYVAN